LTYQGTWDASTNTPTLVSSVGVQGYYYVVSVAGNTDLNGTTTWDVGDWAIFNGSAWQKIEGGTVGTFTNVITPQVTARTDNLTLSAISTGNINFTTPNGTAFRVLPVSATSSNWLQVGNPSPTVIRLGPAGTTVADFRILAPTFTSFYTGSSADGLSDGFQQFRVANTASAVNRIEVTGAATGGGPTISAQGSDANPHLLLTGKGSGGVKAATYFQVGYNYANYLSLSGSNANQPLTTSAAGSDTNIPLLFQTKGTGAIDLATGSSGINISNGGTITGITRSGTGSGYSSAPTVTIATPTTAGGVQATAQASGYGSTANVVVSGGTGYTLNDVITVSAAGTGGTYTVTGVTGGVVTAVTTTGNGGTYTSIPTNPVATTGGTGTGLTLNLSNFYIVNFSILTAGSGYVEQPTVTVSGGGGSGASAYVTVGSPTIIRSLGGLGNSAQSLSLHTSSGETLRLATGTSQATNGTPVANFFQIAPGSSGNGPAFSAIGTDTNIWALISSKGTGSVALQTNSGVTQALISNTTSAVNYIQVTGATTGGFPSFSAQGSDSNPGIYYTTKGFGSHRFTTNTGGGSEQFRIITNSASTVNFLQVVGSATGLEPQFSVQGTDADISLAIQSKGTGAIDLAAGTTGVNISNGNTVTTITRTNAGVGYTTAPTWTASAPTTSGGTTATGTTTLLLYSPVINAGGTGYTVNDVLTIVGGTRTVAAQLTVTSVSAGVITGVTILGGGTYTATPTYPASVTGGTGSGATFTLSAGIFTLAIGVAGSGYIEQPTVSFSGGGGSGATANVTVGNAPTLRSISSALSIFTPSGEAFRVSDNAAGTATGYWQCFGATVSPQLRAQGTGSGIIGTGSATPVQFITNMNATFSEQFRVSHVNNAVNYLGVQGAATAQTPGIVAFGTDTNVAVSISSKGGSPVQLITNSFAALQFVAAHTASAVNYVQVTGASTTNAPAISVQGSDTNIGLVVSAKGNGAITLRNNNSANIQFRADGLVSAVNYLQVAGSLTTNAPILSSQGADTNISMVLQSKGTGAINLATGSTGINISNGNTVTALTRTATGSGYTTPPTWTASAPTTAFGVTASGSVNNIILVSATIAGGGTGYTVGDTLTIVGGTFTVAATLTVLTVSAGVITSVTSPQNGLYTVAPTTPVSVTGGTGSSATFNVSFGISPNFTITTAGSGYVEQPTVTFSGGGGSAAAAYATVGGATTIKSIGTTSGSSLVFQTPSSITSNLPAMRILDGTSGYDTFVTIQPASAYAVISAAGNAGANLFLSATGAGSVRLMTGGTSLVEQMRVVNTASAVNFLQVTGSTTGNLPAISAQGSDTNIGMTYTSKGFNGSHRFQLGGAEALRIEQFGSTAVVNRFSMFANISGGIPLLSTRGTDTNVGFDFSTQGASNYRFYTNTASNGTGVVQLAITHTATAVNYVQVTGSVTGQAPNLTAQGSDSNVGVDIRMKGAAGLRVQNSSQLDLFRVTGNSGTVANYLRANASLAGVEPFLSADGTDTNIDLALTPKGTGRVKYGTHTVTADAPITGYIEILDSSGTIRKLAVIT
jgi:hypothetical protein